LRKEIEALRKLNDENVSLANELKNILQDMSADQQQLVSVAQGQQQHHTVLVDQIHNSGRTAAHANSLLKRTNQLATDAISKNTIYVGNIRRLEEYVLEGDSGSKKLASLVYKKLAAESFSSFTLAANLSYNAANTKHWKKDKEKRGFFLLKDNFLFMYRNEKGVAPQDIVYLGDGIRLSPLSEEQAKRKHCFKLGELFLIAADSPEQYSEWMLALSTPSKWYDSAEDPKMSKMSREESKSPVVDTRREMKDAKKTENGVVLPSFGVPLEELFAREGGIVPAFFTKMLQFLEAKGLQEEGILRLSGSVAEISKLKEALQHGEDVDFFEHDPHAVAGLLKCFLRELPDPLIPEPYHSRSLELMGNSEILDEQKTVQVKMIIDQLPPENHAILRALMSFLVRVYSAADKNKMTILNLITCMVPTLKCVPGIFMYVIPNFDFVFDVNWEHATEDQKDQNNGNNNNS